MQISHGVTKHGAALNVSTDLSFFDNIVPCGIADKEVTSLHRQLGRSDLALNDVARAFLEQFRQQFRYSSCQPIAREGLTDEDDALAP